MNQEKKIVELEKRIELLEKQVAAVTEKKLREEFHAMVVSEIKEKLSKMNTSIRFWNVKDLERETGMEWDDIKTSFFHEETFPRCKVGPKWFFPADECRSFLKAKGVIV